MEKFIELGASEKIAENLKKAEITEPTAVQKETIPLIFENKNLLFQSETGTGKTLAFLIPLLTNIEKNPSENKSVQLIIVSPTHELASQIKGQVALCTTETKCALFIGSAPIKRQIETLKEKPAVVAGSAARIIELFRLKKLKLDQKCVLVLDEVDRLLSKEMIDDTKVIISILPKENQVIGCSATINKKIEDLIKKSGNERIFETKFLPQEDVLRKRITHIALFAERREKIEILRKLIAAENIGKALIFTSVASNVENIAMKLRYHKIDCEMLASKTDKQKRKAAMDRFKSGKAKFLVTSDLASRGLDIQNITHVIQMDLPVTEDFFIHRAGRTARAGKTGMNIVIGDAVEMQKYAQLEKKLKIIVYPKILYQGKLIAPDQETN